MTTDKQDLPRPYAVVSIAIKDNTLLVLALSRATASTQLETSRHCEQQPSAQTIDFNVRKAKPEAQEFTMHVSDQCYAFGMGISAFWFV